MSYKTTYYVKIGATASKVAYDVYSQYIRESNGECRDVLQAEDDGTFSIFKPCQYLEWATYPFNVRYYKRPDENKIVKSVFQTARDLWGKYCEGGKENIPPRYRDIDLNETCDSDEEDISFDEETESDDFDLNEDYESDNDSDFD